MFFQGAGTGLRNRKGAKKESLEGGSGGGEERHKE